MTTRLVFKPFTAYISISNIDISFNKYIYLSFLELQNILLGEKISTTQEILLQTSFGI